MVHTISRRLASLAFVATVILAGSPVNAAPAAAPAPTAAAAASATRGKAIITQFESSVHSAASVTFSMSVSGQSGTDVIKQTSLSFSYQKPIQLAIDVVQDGKNSTHITSTADGGYVVDVSGNRYAKLDKTTDTAALMPRIISTLIQMQLNGPLPALGLPLALIGQPHALSSVFGPDATVRAYDGSLNGAPIVHVAETMVNDGATFTIDYYEDKSTQMPVRISVLEVNGGKTMMTTQYAFTDVKIGDTPIPDSTFQYTPPSTMSAFIPKASPQEAPILANGSAAPDFSVQDLSGKTVKLSDFAGKVVVIDFWSTWCGPCQASLPGTDKVAKTYQTKGVAFLPVCSWDDKSAFTPWAKKRSGWSMKFYFDPAGRSNNSIAGTLFKVSGIPTQFVVGKDGKVVAGFVGYDGPASEKNLTDAIDKALAAS